MFWFFAGAVLVADRLLKLYIDHHFAVHESRSVIQGVLSILYVRNEGAAFSLPPWPWDGEEAAGGGGCPK